jgi:mannose-6-phosphate isomerase-like protein (cupin superfamily)
VDAKTLAKMSPEEKEAYHREQEAKVQKFSYKRPDSENEKDILRLSKTRLGGFGVQVVREGGENNLHYHNNSDTTWFVLRGGVRFYGPGDVLIAELGPEEGIAIPGGARYWFEKTGDVELELLQCVSFDPSSGDSQRVNVEKHKDWMKDSYLRVYEPAAT